MSFRNLSNPSLNTVKLSGSAKSSGNYLPLFNQELGKSLLSASYLILSFKGSLALVMINTPGKAKQDRH